MFNSLHCYFTVSKSCVQCYLLQMFGSIAPLLTPLEEKDSSNFEKISSIALFELLQALEKEVPDDLDILELVTGDKPLVALVIKTIFTNINFKTTFTVFYTFC